MYLMRKVADLCFNSILMIVYKQIDEDHWQIQVVITRNLGPFFGVIHNNYSLYCKLTLLNIEGAMHTVDGI